MTTHHVPPTSVDQGGLFSQSHAEESWFTPLFSHPPSMHTARPGQQRPFPSACGIRSRRRRGREVSPPAKRGSERSRPDRSRRLIPIAWVDQYTQPSDASEQASKSTGTVSDMDGDDDVQKTKWKWWERSALAARTNTTNKRAQGDGDGDENTEDKVEPGLAPSEHPGNDPGPHVATPGAVAVHGPGYRGNEDDPDDGSTVRVGAERGGGGGQDDDEATDAPLQVDSYAVHVGPTDEEIRQQILAGTAHAEAVTVGDKTTDRRNRSTVLLVMGVAVVVAAVVIGAAVPLATRSSPVNTGEGAPDEAVVASVTYLEYQGSGGYAMAIRAETRRTNGALVTSGAQEGIACRPKVCLESDDTCVVGKVYSPGCCTGADCTNETKCGERCPMPPESCYLKDPANTTCIRSECYTCNQYDGKDIYNIRDYAWESACLEVGTAVRPENGQMYKWAISCGPVILGPVVEENRDVGEYQCTALRVGANFSDDDGGLSAPAFPCQYLALAECGCGPSDMYTFGLPDPTGPCLPEGGCPLLCEGAPPDYNLCRSFPGNISYWEGRNVFASSLFMTDILAPKYKLEIYIKE
jgi:hypothetical protein